MPIEFRCTHCNRLLRTGDDTAGKQAQCPECGAITTIPPASTAAPLGAVPPPGAPSGDSRFPAAGFPSEQPSAYGTPLAPLLPEQAENVTYAAARAYAAARIAAPATALIVISVLGILSQMFFFGQLARFGADAAVSPWLRQLVPELAKLPADVVVTASAAGAAGALVVCLVMLFGALSMKKVHGYGFAMAAAILAVIPCTSPCCLGLPFGIWALVVLNDPAVKAAFRR